MRVLRVCLFGGLSLAWENTPRLAVPGVPARSLLAYLITFRHRSHTRHLLAGTFWPDLPEDIAHRRLSQALWQIRHGFKPYPVLIKEGSSVQLNPELPIWCDVEAFTHHYALGQSDDDESLDHYAACLDHYGGEFLAGYYDDWLLPERERLRTLHLDVLTRLTAVYKSQGDYEKALVYASQLTFADPWNEDAHREVMRLYHLLGRDADARSQYDRCCQMLRNELGVDPSPETQALAVEIADQSGWPEIPWVPSPARSGLTPLLEHPDRLPLVGRQAELAELLNQLEAAARGDGGLTLIYGEVGVGKTHLLRELARNAQWRGIPAAWGRCYELTGPPAYQPLIEVLRPELPALREDALQSVWRAELARLLPELAAGEAPPRLEPETERHRLLEAITQGFQAITRTTPHLIVLEDAQWMDPDSLAAIRYVLPRLAKLSLLLVISVRTEDLAGVQAAALTALESTRLPHCLYLSRLDLDESGELIQRALDLPQPPLRFSIRLFAETEGNPFFLTETLRALMDDGLLYRDADGVWSTPWDESTQDYVELSLPGTVIQSITRRLARLPAPSKAALDLAAVIGRGVAFPVWQRASALAEMDLLTIGDQLCAQGILLCTEESPIVQADADYIFAHDQIRRVVYRQLAPPRLRFCHRRIAEALTDLAVDEPAALAYHWSAAQVWDKAACTHQQAGQRAWAVYAHTEALDHFSQALDALQRLPAPPDLSRIYAIRLDRERVYDLQGDREAQAQELAALSSLAEMLDQDCLRAEVALRRARLAELTCDFAQANESARRAARLARAAQEPTIEIASYFERGWSYLMQGTHAAARSQFDQALTLAQANRLPRLEADVLHGLGTIDLVTGDFVQAKRYFQQVLEISRQVDIRPREGSTFANLGYIATAQGDHAASQAYNEEALRIHRETGDQRGVALVTQNLSDEYLARGDFATAKDLMEEALAIQQTIQAPDNIGVTLRGLGNLHHQLGDFARAKDYYDQAQTIFVASGIPYYQGQTLAYQSLLSHHLGDQQAALEQSEHGLGIAQEIDDRLGQGWLLDAKGHALTALGQLDQAEEAYRQALALRRKLGEPHLRAESLAGLARVALRRGEFCAARTQVEEILRILNAGEFGGVNEPLRIFMTCYQVLAACQDPRSSEILATAHALLMAQKAHIHDPGRASSFLENVAAHREIVTAYAAQTGAKVVVHLPKTDAPTGRPLGPEERVAVAWTPYAPTDAAISGKTERRRHQLQRLLAEAAAQSAAPTLADLAAAVAVSAATVKRDLDALRGAGFPVQTRGSRKAAPK